MTAVLISALLTQAELFPVKEGYTWEYRETATVEGKKSSRTRTAYVSGRAKSGELECFVLEGWGGGGRALVSVDAEGVRVAEMDGAAQKSPVLFFRFPLEAGKKWTAEFAEGEEVRTLSFEVFAKEAVEVPAGRFEAVPVDVRAEGVAARIWLAPEVGEVRSRYAQGKNEVVSELERFEKRVRRFQCVKCGKLSDEQKECCGERPGIAKFVRPAKVCRCELTMGKDKCKCLHCKGEKGAACYCGTGGCKCGSEKDKCACGHCAGADGGDDGKDGCGCGKNR